MRQHGLIMFAPTAGVSRFGANMHKRAVERTAPGAEYLSIFPRLVEALRL
jgi:hypothetical protein